jgi:hypothetical protein
MGRPRGSKNRPKELLDERLAQLTAIVADPSQNIATRRAAAEALQGALATPPEPEPQALPPWWDDPDPWSDNPAECARCAELWRLDPRNKTPASGPSSQVPQVDIDMIDTGIWEKELLG